MNPTPALCMMSRVARAELRVYSPLDSFAGDERERWEAYVAAGRRAPALAEEWPTGWASLDRLISQLDRGDPEAYVKVKGESVLVCPRRLDVRALTGLLSVRSEVIPALAESVLPSEQAERAARELERAQARHPERSSHILCSAWQVPASWFVAVDDSERLYEVGAHGRASLTYDTRMPLALERVAKSVATAAHAGLGEMLVGLLRTLEAWLTDFPSGSYLELDYGTVAALFTSEALADDHSARDVRAAVDALRKGDVIQSGFHYAALTERWAAARSRELNS